MALLRQGCCCLHRSKAQVQSAGVVEEVPASIQGIAVRESRGKGRSFASHQQIGER